MDAHDEMDYHKLYILLNPRKLDHDAVFFVGVVSPHELV